MNNECLRNFKGRKIRNANITATNCLFGRGETTYRILYIDTSFVFILCIWLGPVQAYRGEGIPFPLNTHLWSLYLDKIISLFWKAAQVAKPYFAPYSPSFIFISLQQPIHILPNFMSVAEPSSTNVLGKMLYIYHLCIHTNDVSQFRVGTKPGVYISFRWVCIHQSPWFVAEWTHKLEWREGEIFYPRIWKSSDLWVNWHRLHLL